MSTAAAIEALTLHLEREASCVRALHRLLVDERSALAALDARRLVSLAHSKQVVLDAQAQLVRERFSLLETAGATSGEGPLRSLEREVSPAEADRLRIAREALTEAVRRVQPLQALNARHAESGRALVNAALERLSRRTGGLTETYGANGRYPPRAVRAQVEERG